MSEPTISGKLVDGVFRRVLTSDLSPELIASLAAVGLDVSKPSPAAVPKETWYRSVELTSASLFGDEPTSQRKLGRHVIDSLQARNLVKGPWLSMAKLIGPKRALKQAAEHSEGYSPVALKLVERDGKAVEVHADEGRQPEFLAGLLEGLLLVLGAKEPRVDVTSATPHRAVFSATWR